MRVHIVHTISIAILFVIVIIQHFLIGELRGRMASVETKASVLMAGYRTQRQMEEHKRTGTVSD